MITIGIHIPSIFIGFLIGYALIAAVWLKMSFNSSEWGEGWDYGYKSGIEEGKRRAKEAERRTDEQTD